MTKFVPSPASYGLEPAVSALGPATGIIAADAMEQPGGWKKHAVSIAVGVTTGLTISVLAALIVPWVQHRYGIKAAKEK